MMAPSSEDRMKIVELKEQAKWGQNLEAMRRAVTELANYGEKAIPMLNDIMYVTVHEEVKSACIEAIRKVRGEQQRQPEAAVTSDNKSAAVQQKEEGEREKERAKKKEKKEA